MEKSAKGNSCFIRFANVGEGEAVVSVNGDLLAQLEEESFSQFWEAAEGQYLLDISVAGMHYTEIVEFFGGHVYTVAIYDETEGTDLTIIAESMLFDTVLPSVTFANLAQQEMPQIIVNEHKIDNMKHKESVSLSIDMGINRVVVLDAKGGRASGELEAEANNYTALIFTKGEQTGVLVSNDHPVL